MLFRRGLTSSRSAQSYTHASASCRAHSTQLTNRGSRKRRRIGRTMTIGAYLFVAHRPPFSPTFVSLHKIFDAAVPCTPRFYVGFAQYFCPGGGRAIHLTALFHLREAEKLGVPFGRSLSMSPRFTDSAPTCKKGNPR